MKLFRYTPVLLLLLPIAALSVGMIVPEHDLRGDFSLYLRQAKSICQGDAYKVFLDMQEMLRLASDKLYSPTLYPWGYPLLIAPVYAYFGLNFYAYKLVQWGFVLLGVFFLYQNLSRQKEFRYQAWFVAFYVSIQPQLLYYLNFIASEAPYFCFVMASWCAVRSVDVKEGVKQRQFIKLFGLGVLLIFTAQIRTEGFLLLPALAISWLPRWIKMRKSDQWIALTPFFTAIAFFLVLHLLLPSGFLRHLDHTSGISLDRVTSNLLFYFHSIEGFFPFAHVITAAGFLVLALIGMISRLKSNLFECSFMILSIGLFSVWPHQNTRHLLALFPFLLYFFILGIDTLQVAWRQIALSVVFMAFLTLLRLPLVIAMGMNGWINPHPASHDDPFHISHPDYQALVVQVQEKVAPHERVAFAHSRMLYLSTDRLTFPKFGPVEEIKKEVDWYIYCRENEFYFQYNSQQMQRYKQLFEEVYRNPSYILYKVIQ